MDDAFLVRRLHRVHDLSRELDAFRHRNRAAAQALGERLAFDELEHEEACAVRLFETVNRSDARVVERGEQFCFALESAEALFVLRERFGESFDRDVSTELRVACLPDFAHAAFAELRGDLVVGQRFA